MEHDFRKKYYRIIEYNRKTNSYWADSKDIGMLNFNADFLYPSGNPIIHKTNAQNLIRSVEREYPNIRNDRDISDHIVFTDIKIPSPTTSKDRLTAYLIQFYYVPFEGML